MQTIVKTTAASDFLALVPRLVGFRPNRSVVLVAFRGNRTCGALRCDLPSTGAKSIHKRVATTMMGMLCRIPAVDAVVPVIYTDESFAECVGERTGIPHEQLATVLVGRAENSGFLVRDALCVAADGWGSYLDDQRPADGRPLAEIATSSVHEKLPAGECGELAGPQERAELPRVDLATREQVAKCLDRYRRAVDDPQAIDDLVGEVGELMDPVTLVEESFRRLPEELTPADLALILFVVQGPPNRDQMMLQFAFGEEVGIRSYELNVRLHAVQRADGRTMDEIVGDEQAEAGDEYEGSDIGELMIGRSPGRPDVKRVRRAIELLALVTSAAPRSARPAPLCMLAWLSWTLGMGSVAGIHLDRAREIDPGYGMAGVLNTLLSSGHLPEWAFNEPVS